MPGAAINLPGAVHSQPGRVILEHEPLYTVYIRLAFEEVVWVALEHRFDIGLVALQHEGASADGALGLLQITKLLHDFRGNNPRAYRVGQHVHQPDKRLFQDELYRIAVDDLDPFYRFQHITDHIPRLSQETIKGKLHVLCHQLATIERRFVVPFDSLTQVEDIGCIIRLLPTLGQVRLYCECARWNLWADFIPHQGAVDKAQRCVGLETDRLMMVKVRGVIAAHAQDAAALGLSSFRTPEHRGIMQWPGGQRDASHEASLEQITTAHAPGLAEMCLLQVHREPPFQAARCITY